MSIAPTTLRCGDYVMNFPVERPGDRDTARQSMKRNGCRCIRFEVSEPQEIADPNNLGRVLAVRTMIAHGYVARVDGPGVEGL